VVAHRAGPLLVVGGPGTGKTTVLVESVAARVAEGVPPDRLLVLTFGRRSAGRLRDRIERRIGAIESAPGPVAGPGDPPRPSRVGAFGEPLVRTFHAYAFGLLRRAAAQLGDPPPRLLTGPEQDLVIRELLAGDAEGWPVELRPALRTRAFAGQLRDLLLRSAERGIGPGELARLGRIGGAPTGWPRPGSCGNTRRCWRCATRPVGPAWPMTTPSSFGPPPGCSRMTRVAGGERRRMSTVYLDELADTDPAQLDLLALVAGNGAHLVAFADPDSSTYAFRGADPGGVTDFPTGSTAPTAGPRRPPCSPCPTGRPWSVGRDRARRGPAARPVRQRSLTGHRRRRPAGAVEGAAENLPSGGLRGGKHVG